MADQVTIAQLKAVISADTAALESRLSRAEQRINETANTADKAAKTIEESFTRTANGGKKLEATYKELERGAANLAKFEYKTGQTSAADYKAFLKSRMSSYASYTAEWKAAATELASLEKSLQAEIDANDKALIRDASARWNVYQRERISAEQKANAEITSARAAAVATQQTALNLAAAGRIAAGANAGQVIRDLQMQNAMKTITSPQASAQQQQAASEKIIQLTRAEVEARTTAEKEKQAAIFNTVRFEYDQGLISQELYMAYLRKRLTQYEAYSSEWKAAASELLQVERTIDAERAEADALFNSQARAQAVETARIRVQSEKEADALIVAAAKEAQATSAAAMAQRVEAEKAAQVARGSQLSALGAVAGMGGTGAAVVTAIEAGSAGLFSHFQANTAAVANNAVMTDAALEDMRKQTIKVGKDTGAVFDDISNGYMRIRNHIDRTASANEQAAFTYNVLNDAAKEAVSTQSKVDSTANALASTMHVFHLKGEEAHATMGVLDQAAARGNAKMEQWVLGTGQATAAAAAYGVKLTDVQAALSALTQQRFSIGQSDTQIRGILTHIANPIPEVRKELALLQPIAKSMGIDLIKDFSGAGLAARGLYNVLRDIKAVSGGNTDTINKLLQAQRGGLGATVLMNKGADDYTSTYRFLEQMRQGQVANPVDIGFERQSKTFQNQLARLVNSIEADFLPVGERALKVFETWLPRIEAFSKYIANLMDLFQKLPLPIQNMISVLGGLTILNKLTGILIGLKVPIDLRAGLLITTEIVKKLATGITTLTGAQVASTGASLTWGARLATLGATAGPIALVALAVVGLIYELSKLKDSYDEMVTAQDQAAKSAQNFVNMQKEVSAQSTRGAIEVEMGKIAQTISGRETAKQTYYQQLTQSDNLRAKGLPDDTNRAEVQKNLDQAIFDLHKLKSDYAKQASNLHALTSNNQAGSGTVNVTTPGDLGGAIAATAARKQMDKTALDYHHHCQELFRVTVQESTHIFDHLFKGSAFATEKAMQAAGVLQPFIPGQTVLKPGDALFSHTMAMHEYNKKTGKYESYGHVAEIGREGDRFDQYGTNHFGLNNFQSYFDPDYAKAKLYGDGAIPNMPPTTHGIDQAMLDKLKAEADAKKKAEKAAEAAAKALVKRYDNEVQGLNKVIFLKNVEVDTETRHVHLNQELAKLQEGGDLYGISNSQKNILLDKAKQADLAESAHRVALSIKKLNDENDISALPLLKRQAIGQLQGGLSEWKEMSDSQKQDMLSKMASVDRRKEVIANTKAMHDLAFAQKNAGDEVARAAVQAAGGADTWDLLTEAERSARIEATRQTMALEELNSLTNSWATKASESLAPVKTQADAARIAIEALINKLHISRNDPQYKSSFDQIIASGNISDQNNTRNWLDEQNRNIDLQSKQLQEKMNRKFSPENSNAGQSAVDQWNKTNNDQIAKLFGSDYNNIGDFVKFVDTQNKVRKQGLDEAKAVGKDFMQSQTRDITEQLSGIEHSLSGLYTDTENAVFEWETKNKTAITNVRRYWGTEGDLMIKDYENSIVSSINKADALRAKDALISNVNGMQKQLLDARSTDPFHQWLNGFRELKVTLDKDGNRIMDYILPTDMDEKTMEDFWKKNIDRANTTLELAKMFQGLAQGTSSGIMEGITNAFNPNPQAKGQAQTDLYNLKQQLEQAQMGEASYRYKYGQGASGQDPYTQRIKDIQHQIDITNDKLHGMGNNLQNVFGRLFGTIANNFKQTIAKMAQDYLQSQLMQYLTRQIGSGSGFSGGMSWLGGLIGGIMGGSGGSASPLSNGDPFGAGFDGPIPTFGDGGHYSGLTPIIVGERGEPEFLVPDRPGTVTPLSKMGYGKSSTREGEETPIQHVTNVKFTQIVNTPDVRGMRSSKVTQGQQIAKNFGIRRKR